MTSAMYAKHAGRWEQVYPEPNRGVAPTLSGAIGNTQIVYTWTAATGITPATYELKVDGVIQDVGNVLTFTKTGLTNGTAYAAQVRAVSAENVKGAWSNIVTATPAAFNNATGGTITEVPNYNGTGETWRIHHFTSAGDFTISAASQPFRVLVVGGGDNAGYGGGNGGKYIANDSQTLTVGVHPVTIGGPSAASTLGSITSANGTAGGAGGVRAENGGPGGAGVKSNILGTGLLGYAGGGGGGGIDSSPNSMGNGGVGGGAGVDGGGNGGGAYSDCCTGGNGGGNGANGTPNTGGGGGGAGCVTAGANQGCGASGAGATGVVAVGYRIG